MPPEEKLTLIKETESSKPEDKRRHPRKRCSIDATYICDGATGRQIIRDISLGGVFIETSETLRLGQVITLLIPFANQDRKIKIKGKVVRVAPGGIGIEFDKSSVDTE